MEWTRSIARRWRALFRKDELEHEMAEEMRIHLEMEAEELMRTRGLSEAEARRQARLAFGSVTRFEEEGREARGALWLGHRARDLRYAARSLAKNPGFTVAAVLTLGLGIGAVAAIFTFVNAILLQPLPYPGSERVVVIRHAAPDLGFEDVGTTSAILEHYTRHARSFESIAAYWEQTSLLASGEDRIRIELAAATPELFDVLGVNPVLGRRFTEEDYAPVFTSPNSMNYGQTIAVVLSHELWMEHFGGDPGVIGRIIRIDDNPREVVGVLPPGVAFPRPETRAWVVLGRMGPFGFSDAQAVARVRAGVALPAAEAELRRIIPFVEENGSTMARDRGQNIPVVLPLKTAVVGSASAPLWILLAGMGFLFLVACGTVANLFLVRLEHRARELAVRVALGAKRGVLLGLVLTEALLVSVVGAGLGVLLALGSVRALVAFTPVQLPRMQEVQVDGWVIAATLAMAVLAAVLIGCLPLLRLRRGAGVRALRAGGATAGAMPERARLRHGLVTAQVALTLALLVGSGLMIQSYRKLTRVDPGVRIQDVLTAQIVIPQARYAEYDRIYGTLVERLGAMPGVRSAAAVTAVPLTDGAGSRYPVRSVHTTTSADDVHPFVTMRFFSPGYFGTIGTPVVAGADLVAGEPIAYANPVVISASLARRLFPGEEPVGRPLWKMNRDGRTDATTYDPATRTQQPATFTVAAVVADVRDASLRSSPPELVYIPMIEPRVPFPEAPLHMTIVIRSGVPPHTLAASLREAIRSTEPQVTIGSVRSMEAIHRAATGEERFLSILLIVAGTASLFLGAVGVYGVVAYTVRRRVQEIGTRVALGAQAPAIVRLVLRGSIPTVVLGVVFGVGAALTGTRVMQSLLYEISATDPLTIAAAAALMVGVALSAGLLPAVRAARVDPMIAIRAE